MTETPPPPPPGPTIGSAAAVQSGTPGTAIASLIVSTLGFCVPGLGLVGVVLGILGVLASRKRRSGVGIAVAGIAVGFVAMSLNLAVLVGMLPKALHAARMVKTEAQLTHIHRALLMYLNDVPDAAQGSDFATRLFAANYTSADVWTSPFAPDDIDLGGFVFGYLDETSGAVPHIITLDPSHPAHGLSRFPVIDSAGDHFALDRTELEELLRSLTVYHADGHPWRPAPPQP